MKRIVLCLALCCSSFTTADPVSSALELTKLTEMIASLNEQLEMARNTLNVQEQMKQMEELALVKEISKGGQALWELADEIESTVGIVSSFGDLDDNFNELKRDINNYLTLYENASNEEDALSAIKQFSKALVELDDQYWTGSESVDHESIYHLSRLVSDIERLQTLKKAQQENLVAISEGLDEKDAALVTATDTNSLLNITIDTKTKELVKEAREAEINLQEEKAYNAFASYGVINVEQGDDNE